MAGRIERRDSTFIIIGENKGFSLAVDCSERLRRYNAMRTFLDTDLAVVEAFDKAVDVDSLAQAIETLKRKYQLQRKPVFPGSQFAPILSQHLGDIGRVPGFTGESIETICKAFDSLNATFTERLSRSQPLPEVSLSKLLHFLRPDSFWILDSRVYVVLDVWGYEVSFSGFGRLVSDLLADPHFAAFQEFLHKRNHQLLPVGHPLRDRPCSFLKLLDKVLWLTRQA